MAEVGIDIGVERPRQLTRGLIDAAGLVVVLGNEAHVDTASGTPVVRWEVDEPSSRGIEGIERMRLVRDDITAQVRRLLGPSPKASSIG